MKVIYFLSMISPSSIILVKKNEPSQNHWMRCIWFDFLLINQWCCLVSTNSYLCYLRSLDIPYFIWIKIISFLCSPLKKLTVTKLHDKSIKQQKMRSPIYLYDFRMKYKDSWDHGKNAKCLLRNLPCLK